MSDFGFDMIDPLDEEESIEEIAERKKKATRTSLLTSPLNRPVKTQAEMLGIQQETGMPDGVVEPILEEMKEDKQRSDIMMNFGNDEFLTDHPATAEMLEEPENVALLKDDIENV